MKKTIERIVDYAARIAEPEKIILFGSINNGTSNVHSDVDLLLVVNKEFAKQQMIERIQHFAQEMALTADVLVCSKRELGIAAAEPDSFLSGIVKKGTIMYEKVE